MIDEYNQLQPAFKVDPRSERKRKELPVTVVIGNEPYNAEIKHDTHPSDFIENSLGYSPFIKLIPEEYKSI